MSIQNFRIKCTMMDRKQVPSPNGGGMINLWQNGKQFEAAIATTSTRENTFAGQLTDRQYYSVYVDKDMSLQKNDYFKNERNGRFVRVASLSIEPPQTSSFKFKLMYGEYVDELPN